MRANVCEGNPCPKAIRAPRQSVPQGNPCPKAIHAPRQSMPQGNPCPKAIHAPRQSMPQGNPCPKAIHAQRRSVHQVNQGASPHSDDALRCGTRLGASYRMLSALSQEAKGQSCLSSRAKVSSWGKRSVNPRAGVTGSGDYRFRWLGRHDQTSSIGHRRARRHDRNNP